MKLTTKGKFAITALLDIAMYSNNGLMPINLIQVSKRQGISLSYLEQLFVKLRRNGIIKSFRGPGGGYILTKEPAEIKVSEIIQAVDEDMDARTCHGLKNCNQNNQCLTHDLWHGLTKHVLGYLDAISLKDLITKNLQNKNFVPNNSVMIATINTNLKTNKQFL